MWHDGQFTYRLTLRLWKGRIPSSLRSMQQHPLVKVISSGSNLEVRQQQEDGIMLNGNWYRMTEKQDLESPSEPGIEFEAFNISEAKRISTRRQKVKGTVLVLEELTGRPHVVSVKDAIGKWTDAEETSD